MLTKEISGVEIFSAGTWNEETYTVDDLNEMVRAFNENTSGTRPRLKLGHDPKQRTAKKMLSRDPEADGVPAIGWIEKLYVKGEKLVADFSHIHEKVYSAIQKRAYRKVSSEIFHNIKIGEKTYKKMLAAVALLGEDCPGVLNLEDIMSSYSKFEAKFDKVDTHEFNWNSKTKGESMDLEKALAALEEANQKIAAAETAQKEKDAEVATLKEFKATAEKREQELLLAAETARVEKFTTELVSEKLSTPAMKPLIEQLLGPEKKEYTVGEKKMTKEETLKEVLKLYKAAAEVNFEENSEAGDDGQKDKDSEREAKAKKYAAEKKISFGAALKEVYKQENEQV